MLQHMSNTQQKYMSNQISSQIDLYMNVFWGNITKIKFLTQFHIVREMTKKLYYSTNLSEITCRTIA